MAGDPGAGSPAHTEGEPLGHFLGQVLKAATTRGGEGSFDCIALDQARQPLLHPCLFDGLLLGFLASTQLQLGGAAQILIDLCSSRLSVGRCVRA